MKKLNLFAAMVCFATMAITMVSCNQEEEQTKPQEATITIDYTFAESGSMSRATGGEVYGNFYDKYIKPKVLTPKTYYLEFKEVSNNGTILTINGEWGEKRGIRLPEGEYLVAGYSRPIEKYADQPAYLPSDTVYMLFEETVSITKDMDELVLNAKYDSFLLLFDYGNMTSIELNVGPRQLNHDESCYWLFVKDKHYTNWDNGFSFTHYLSTEITRPNGDVINLEFGQLPLKKGKYYYFNDMTNSFDLQPMESGN